MGALLPPLVSCHGSEKAQGMIEYALIAAFICVFVATVFAAPGWLPDRIDDLYGAVLSRVEAVTGN